MQVSFQIDAYEGHDGAAISAATISAAEITITITIVPTLKYGPVKMILPESLKMWRDLRDAIHADSPAAHTAAVVYSDGRHVADVYRGVVRFHSDRGQIEFEVTVPCADAIAAICRGCEVLADFHADPAAFAAARSLIPGSFCAQN